MWRKKVGDNSFPLGWQGTLSNHVHEQDETRQDPYQQERKRLKEHNLKAAIENLEVKPLLEQKKEEVKQLCDTILQMCDELGQKQTNLTTKRNRTINTLEKTVESRKRESEAILNLFLEADMDVNEFVDEFISGRASFHGIELKREKLKELLNIRERFGTL